MQTNVISFREPSNPVHMTQEELEIFLVWEQSKEDRAAIAEYIAECNAVARGEFVSREPGTVAARPSALDS